MAGSKKQVKQKCIVSAKSIPNDKNPDAFYQEYPSWNFNTCDPCEWSFNEQTSGAHFWHKILPRLQALEKMKWREIFLDAKKYNHRISADDLTDKAQKRLADLKIEADGVYSIDVQAIYRIYGTMNGAVFNILWFDYDHGDNGDCVCRSRRKHT